MKKQGALSAKKKQFCLHYAAQRDARTSAVKAGYLLFPENTAVHLLCQPEIRAEIEQISALRKVSRQEVCEGYRRLAFGSVADVLKFLTSQTPAEPQDLEKLDFFNVSDIKYPKSGGMEIKFFDRLKALDALAKLEDRDESDGLAGFMQALDKTAKAIGNCEED